MGVWNNHRCVPTIGVFVIGLTAIIWGAVTIVHLEDCGIYFDEHFSTGSVLMIVAGCFVLFIALVEYHILGHHPGIIIKYSLLFLIIMSIILFFASGVKAMVDYKDDSSISGEVLQSQLNRYGQPDQTEFTNKIDYVQQEMSCCGSFDYTDWFSTEWGKSNPNSVPDSCCISPTENCGTNVTVEDGTIHTAGCYSPLLWQTKNIIASVVCGSFLYFYALLIGIIITILGAVFNGQLKLYSNVTEDNYKIESGLMIASGCFLVLAVCLDECTAKSKNAYLIGMAFLLISLSFVMLLSAGIVACVHVRDLNYKYEDQLIAGLDKYDHSTQYEFSASMDLIQQKYECCGVTNYTDWFNTTWGQLHKSSVPNSCCVTYEQKCGINFEVNNITIFQQGCFWPVKESIHGYVTAIACFCIVLFITILIVQVMLRFIKPSQTEVL